MTFLEHGWLKTSFCEDSSGSCVEVRPMPHAFAVRHSQHDGQILVFSTAEWTAFKQAIKNDEFPDFVE